MFLYAPFPFCQFSHTCIFIRQRRKRHKRSLRAIKPKHLCACRLHGPLLRMQDIFWGPRISWSVLQTSTNSVPPTTLWGWGSQWGYWNWGTSILLESTWTCGKGRKSTLRVGQSAGAFDLRSALPPTVPHGYTTRAPAALPCGCLDCMKIH